MAANQIIPPETVDDMVSEHKEIMQPYIKKLESVLINQRTIYAITFENGEPIFQRVRSKEEIMIQATIDALNESFRHKMEWIFKAN